MLKKQIVPIFIILTTLVGLVGFVSAQRGFDCPQGNTPNAPQHCQGDPQMDAYRYGGMGFVDPGSGNQWNNQQRGNMRGQRGAGEAGVGMYLSLPPAVEGDIPADLVELMNAGYTDEVNAFNIYAVIIEQFGEVTPFVNIQRAEAQHIAAWEFLFDRYSLELPEITAVDMPTFDSVSDACSAAADAEIANFGLYDDMLAAFSDYPDITQVITALRNASQYNHLPAFEACAAR